MTTLLLATAIERAGVLLAVFTVVAWIVWIVVTARSREPGDKIGSEIELAPNRKPYYDDEQLEGRRLERFLGWALVLLGVCAIWPMVYWLNEPARQAGAVQQFDKNAVSRGRTLFLPTNSPEPGAHFGCATCHGGEKAEGGVAPFTITDEFGNTRPVQWQAPRLDTVLKRFSPAEVRQILVYGRPNTPMPAWGVAGGGAMNDQQIDDLVAYVTSIQISDDAAKKITVDQNQTDAKTSGLPADSGQTLFRTNCARCHTKGWSYGEPDVMGGGAFGPNLTNGDTLRQFPNVDDMIDFVSNGSEPYKAYGTRGIGHDAGGGMPGFGRMLTPDQIKAVVTYVRGL
ncbi:MAG TPA: c-type cytochrome [Acidimicrobiales bacterium]|nr:c-type cytochrome [Acidimicrobiales bacterium]